MRTSGLVVAAFLLVCASPAVAGPRPIAAAAGDAQSPATYQQSDLQGNWEFHTLATGPGEPWWERAHVIIAADGTFNATATYSGGGTDSFGGRFVLSPAGLITLPGSSTFGGALSSDKSVLACTDTWSSGSPGTTEMKVGVRMGSNYKVSDLTGPLELNILASGPGAPFWDRGRLTIASDGTMTGTLTESGGSSDPANGTLTLTSAGIVMGSGPDSSRGAVDVGRTVMAGTATWMGSSDPGTTELDVAVKMASGYHQSDLAGTWEFNCLASGFGAAWWQRAHLVIAADGSFTGTSLSSGGGTGSPHGTFVLASDGTLTLVGSTTFRGVLDAGKAVLVTTDTWASGSPGTTEMKIGTRVSTGTVDVPPAPVLALALDPVRPNPARGGAPTIGFALPSAAPATLELLDVAGRRVATCDLASVGAGHHVRTLAGGTRLEPGLYFVRLRQGAEIRSARVAVVE